METGTIIKKDTILVAVEGQSTACGINYIREGSILKVRKEKNLWSDTVQVFRNRDEESDDRWYGISLDKVREANEREIEMWSKDMYFVETSKTF